VFAFAHWGYTIGDPAASEGERFLAGLNALGRLLAVGSEWAAYATLVPTGGARKAARAAADEASEQLGRQGARQAARKVAQQGTEDAGLPVVRYPHSPHLREQMQKRDITDAMVRLALRRGELLWDPSDRSIIFLVRNTSHRYKEESGITHAYHLALAVDPLSRTIKTAIHGRRAIRPRWVPIDSSPFWWWQR
jgi:hypothetical protein